MASQIPKHTWGASTNRDNVKGTRIVTVPQRNGNAALVTSPKVSIEPKSSRPVGEAFSVALNQGVCVKNVIHSDKATFCLPIKNKFQVLQNLNDNTDESHENAPTALEEVVTASAGTTMQTAYRKLPNTCNKQMYGDLDAVSAPPTDSHNIVGSMLEKHIQLSQLDTLGDGGTWFEPAPESDQAHDCRFPDPNATSYVREEKIPLYIWNNRDKSKDYKACVMQNNGIFGYVPLTDLKTYTGPPVKWDVLPDIIQAHNLVAESGVPNFLKCRIPVETNLNANIWRTYLKDYWDQQLPDLLQFGFPLDFHRGGVITSSHVNHASANQFQNHMDAYIKEELTHNAIYGPFHDPPFPVHISPLMTREKQNSAVRRTIVDLSWPKGESVNDFVHKCKYLDTYFTLQYPSVDDITKKLNELGPGALLFKVDISRAFRQLRIDPGDIDLLGIVHNHLYLDGSVPFGFRLGSGFFERCSDAIRYIMKCHGHNALLNYIDDLIYVGLPSKIHESYSFLLSLLQELGLQVSQNKLVPPSTEVVCLGILINTVDKTISIPPEKLQEIKNMCEKWKHRNSCSRTQLQSLLGSLLYITKCVHPARSFLNRMLQLLRENANVSSFPLSQAFRQDLNWFLIFLQQYNGVTYFDHKKVDFEVHLDASLSGFGANFGPMVYALPLGEKFSHLHITQLEMLNIIVALKVWSNLWQNKMVEIKCDNLAVVEVLNSGKTRDPFLALCGRNVWLISAMFNIQLVFLHIPGKNNHIADLLSRWTITKNPEEKLNQFLPYFIWINTHIDLTALNYNI